MKRGGAARRARRLPGDAEVPGGISSGTSLMPLVPEFSLSRAAASPPRPEFDAEVADEPPGEEVDGS